MGCEAPHICLTFVCVCMYGPLGWASVVVLSLLLSGVWFVVSVPSSFQAGVVACQDEDAPHPFVQQIFSKELL